MVAREVNSSLALLGLTLLLGCQGASQPAGLAPAPAPPNAAAAPAPEGSFGTGLLGAARLTVNRQTGEVSLLAAPTGAAVGDFFALDATQFFTSDPCRDCMRLTSFAFAADELELEVTIRHPFPNTSQRRDLDVFDPRVIVFAPAKAEWSFVEFDTAPTYLRPNPVGGPPTPAKLSANTNFLLKNDGYTTRFDERVDFLYGVNYQGTLNPFRNYATYLIPNDVLSGPNPERRLSQDRAPESETFNIYLPDGVDVFEAIFVLEASYGQSATRPTRMSPTYYIPAFNRKEAYELKATVSSPSAGLEYLSQMDVSVSALDWQQQSPLDLTYPNPASLDAVPVSSRVRDITIVLPGWSANPMTVVTPSSGVGTPSSPLIYSAVLERDEIFPPRPDAVLPLLVIATDEMQGQVMSNTNPAFDLGTSYDAAAYFIDRIPLNVVQTFTTGPSAPGMMVAPTGVKIRPAPYANSDEGVAQLEPIYLSPLDSQGRAPARDLRLLSAPSTGDFRLMSPPGTLLPENVVYASGEKPIDDYPDTPNAHPNPGATMPVTSLAALPNGNFIAGFGDHNFTVNPIRFSTGLTDRVANSDLVRTWRTGGAGTTLGPRLSQGCGSAPGPAFGARVRAVVPAPGVALGGRSNLLGFISAGLNSEACSDFARLDYYGAPYSSESDRVVSASLKSIIIDLFSGVETELKYRQFRGVEPLGFRNANQWFHAAFFGNRVVLFNALQNFNPVTRSSVPIVLGARSTGVENIVDMAYVPYDPDYPFAIGGTAQSTDWLLLLVRGGLGGYRLLALETTNVSLPLVADWNGATPGSWGMTTPIITDMDFDRVNRILILSYDSNGVSAGGDILSTLLMTF